MIKIILVIAPSLDGYIARISGEVDWVFTDQDYSYTELFAVGHYKLIMLLKTKIQMYSLR